MSIELLTTCELSGIRRAIGDQSATTYTDADLRGYVTDSLLELRGKYFRQEFEVSGGTIVPAPDYFEQGIIDLQTKILLMQAKQFGNVSVGGISYQDPVKKIDTRDVSKDMYSMIESEEKRLSKMILDKMLLKVVPIGAPTWQTDNASEDTSLTLNVLET